MIRRLLTVLDPPGAALLRRMLVGLVLCAVLQGIAFALLVPLLRELLGDGGPSGAARWFGALALVFAAYAVCYWDSTLCGYRAGAGLSRTLYRRLGDHVAALPLGWFTPERTDRLTQLTAKGVIDVMGVPAHLLRPVISAFVTPLVVVALMFLFDWRLALAALVGLPLAALAHRVTGRVVARSEHAHHAASAEAGGRVIEFTRSQPVLRAFGRTVHGHRALDDALVAQRDTGRRLLLRAVPGFAAFVMSVQLAFTVVLLTGTVLAIGGSVGAPELIALLVLAARFVEPLVVAADLAAAVRIADNALARVQAVLETAPLPEPEVPATPADPDDTSVELAGVTFGYDPGDPVLRDFSLHVPARSMTALVGPSGSGKTTVTRLVARFFDTDAGRVLVGGTDVRELGTEALMSRISLVFQDVYLFDATISENIRLARPEATEEEFRRATRLAGVDEIAARLPDGWDSRVGEGGTALSGGERQRVSIARALLKDAPIVLLDEATAALDPENEHIVQNALTALARDRTLLVIAHRLQTITAADRIAVLDGGRVAESGTHDELLAAGGRYAAFWSERSRAGGWRLAESRS
ncbi:ATP-binding cassette domain-containing protein [Streptomyces sp. NPDC005955]|uniref:ABC transporter ATP-binding protein n=1 Tax=Streptomyces sp. NPDC005955 TaxID=3364738 RepID=UPI0036BBA46B